MKKSASGSPGGAFSAAHKSVGGHSSSKTSKTSALTKWAASHSASSSCEQAEYSASVSTRGEQVEHPLSFLSAGPQDPTDTPANRNPDLYDAETSLFKSSLEFLDPLVGDCVRAFANGGSPQAFQQLLAKCTKRWTSYSHRHVVSSKKSLSHKQTDDLILHLDAW